MNPLTIRKKMMTLHIFDRRNISIKILLILGVIVSILSIRIMYGMASGEEEVLTSYNLYTALVINPDKELYSDTVIEKIRNKSNHEVENLICITQVDEKAFVVGWDGYSPSRWFAPTSGRFFSQEEETMGKEVAYLSESAYRIKSKPKEVELEGKVYSVIGVGGIVAPSFQNVVPDESIVQLVSYSESMDYDNPYTWIVIPYENYKKFYIPDQILVHYLDITSKELKENAEVLGEEWKECQVLMPKRSLDEESQKLLKEYNGLATFVVGMATICLVQLIREWILAESEKIRIYHLCGMSQQRCICRMVLKTTLLFLTGGFGGVGVYEKLIPMLQRVCKIGEIEMIQETWIAALMFVVLEIETVWMTWRIVTKK